MKIILLAISLFAFMYLPYTFFQGNNASESISPPPLPSNTLAPQTMLTLDSIFSNGKKNPPNSVSIIATGDVIPARSVNFQAVKRGDFLWSFGDTIPFLRNADITLINLESPLVKNCPTTQEGMIFCGDQRHIEGIKAAGIDVANIANNHAGNRGKDGIIQTIMLLESNGIGVSGNGEILYKEAEGIKFAFLGFNNIEKQGNLSPAEEDAIIKQITEADNESDAVIVSFHWGDEYTAQPNNRQKYLARLSVDTGADLVIGNHPHWIQPVEIYKGKLIVYSHGNFIFDQMWSEETKKGVIGKYFFEGGNLIGARFTPAMIRDYGQAYFPEAEESEHIIRVMETESRKLEME